MAFHDLPLPLPLRMPRTLHSLPRPSTTPIPENAADACAPDELLDYMNYMDGIAENLPRVLYVHGSGQEVINFDALG